MSFRANRLRHSPPDDEGYILPTVIVVLTVGAMVAIALLGYAAALLKAGGDDADSVLHLYAADAGITTMKHLLERGTVTPPEPFMFGDVKVEVTSTTTTPRAPGQYRTTVLQPDLLDEYPATVIIQSVPPGTELDVRWQYIAPSPTPSPQPTSTPTPTGNSSPTPTPTPTSTQAPPGNPSLTPTPTPTSTPTPVPPSIKGSVRVRGQMEETPTPTPIVTSTPCLDRQRNCVNIVAPLDELLERMETIRFDFDPGQDKVWTRPFVNTCQARDRSYFCLTAAPRYYVVVSTTGNATVTAYIRQFPGWCESSDGGFTNRATYERCDDVEILSWKPYLDPTPTPNPDDEQDEPTDAPDE